MKYNILTSILKLFFLILILNCLALELNAQTNSILLDDKSYVSTIYQNRKDGLPEQYGIYSKYIFTIDKIELNKADSTKVYNYLTGLSCVANCKINFNKNIIEIRCIDKSYANLKIIQEKMTFCNLRSDNYIEQIYQAAKEIIKK